MNRAMSLRKRQQGLSLTGLIVVGAVMAFAVLLGLRVIPLVTEYLAVQRIVQVVALEGDRGGSPADMRQSFDRLAQLERVTAVSGRDLEIFNQRGKVVVEVAYERRVPIAGNVSLLIAFRAASPGQP